MAFEPVGEELQKFHRQSVLTRREERPHRVNLAAQIPVLNHVLREVRITDARHQCFLSREVIPRIIQQLVENRPNHVAALPGVNGRMQFSKERKETLVFSIQFLNAGRVFGSPTGHNLPIGRPRQKL